MRFNQHHLDFFLDVPLAPQGPVGIAPRAWAATFAPELLQNVGREHVLSERRLSRGDVKASCRLASGSDEPSTFTQATVEECFVTCMAWGGMRFSGHTAWGGRARWLDAVGALRTSKALRNQAFDTMHQLRSVGGLRGIGVAYFTKLLFFLRPGEPDSYIMDQWTAKSVNLLSGQTIVRISGGGWVNNNNTADEYCAYCEIVEEIAVCMTERHGCKKTGQDAEMALMSKGGRQPEPWRSYVVQNWTPG